jgi:hypothetical protein
MILSDDLGTHVILVAMANKAYSMLETSCCSSDIFRGVNKWPPVLSYWSVVRGSSKRRPSPPIGLLPAPISFLSSERFSLYNFLLPSSAISSIIILIILQTQNKYESLHLHLHLLQIQDISTTTFASRLHLIFISSSFSYLATRQSS